MQLRFIKYWVLGLLESSYESCLMYELQMAGITAISQVLLPINYKGISIDAGYRLDILLPIELKLVDKINSIYSAQLLTYMKLTQIKAGLLINFNVKKLVDGVKRFNLPD